jgi:type I restriction enzyme M protein
LNQEKLRSIEIPLPPLEVQREIVAEIEGHHAQIARLNNAILDEEKKIQATLARVWGGQETAPAEA